MSESEVCSSQIVESLNEEEKCHLPLVIFADGARLPEPSPADVAERVGLKTRATQEFYDVAIVGGGPAGLAAAVYGASEGLRPMMVEREAPGGQAGMSSRIENYTADIVLYCAEAHVTGFGERHRELAALGYTNVRDYEGGKEDWIGAGLSVEKHQHRNS